ncbi:DNA mismatch repair endonuclease MutL [Thermosulfurimonas marina]|uniref:DNA mismatch repair protein MutL n=1 Tax=Thermosulfurimonas marina TaxID=2047767 RepID=A0A6H1WTX1_9BACT|nr:DNA mismatch repair endonuclease MutL [Thermosulfurimonas marina]QJA06621.1 DNA mismatch repair endonuclease MutL [Thermosulfurimonas marina]
MPRIRILPQEVSARIAAGEVVERPASVVKELVENALDAGARQVRVELEEGGRRRIQVVDDGEGMSPEDLRLSWRPHATSKISTLEDLSRITTYGFRGEALHSMAQVSRLTLVSRPPSQEEGWLLRVAFGEEEDFRPCGAPTGTTVVVEDLFARLPARRAFLKGPRAETSRVVEMVRLAALARPQTSFRVRQAGRDLFFFPGGSRRGLLSRILSVPEEALRAETFEEKELRAEFLLVSPERAPSTSRHLYFLVNDRVVRDRGLAAALLEGLRGVYPPGRAPAGLLALYLPPHLVDVNVHPAKWEVRFRNEHELYGRLRRWAERLFKPQVFKFYSPSEEEDLPLSAGPPSGPPAERPRVAEGRLFFSEVPSPGPRYLGTLGEKYLLFEVEEGLLLLDFHAAHERILYEDLLSGSEAPEPLLFPAVFELSAEAQERLAALEEDLSALGFSLREAGPREVLVEKVPAGLGLSAVEALREVLEEGLAPERLREELAARLACHLALRAGERLSPEEALRLLLTVKGRGLERCPHGRPLWIILSRDELDRRFGRK